MGKCCQSLIRNFGTWLTNTLYDKVKEANNLFCAMGYWGDQEYC